MAPGKVVYVDFGRQRKPTAGGFGGGPRLLLAVFLAVLGVELLAVAAWHPSAITSFFFGPTVIAVAVVATLGVRRVIARVQVARMYRKTLRGGDSGSGGTSRRTLH